MMRWIELIPIAAAVLCFAAALWLRVSRSRGIRNPVYTEGVVIGAVTQTHCRNRSMVTTMAPKIRYMTEQGERVATSRHFVPEWQYRYLQGEKIKICYQKENPGLFRICRNTSQDWFQIILLAAGAGILLAYAVLWVQYY